MWKDIRNVTVTFSLVLATMFFGAHMFTSQDAKRAKIEEQLQFGYAKQDKNLADIAVAREKRKEDKLFKKKIEVLQQKAADEAAAAKAEAERMALGAADDAQALAAAEARHQAAIEAATEAKRQAELLAAQKAAEELAAQQAAQRAAEELAAQKAAEQLAIQQAAARRKSRSSRAS